MKILNVMHFNIEITRNCNQKCFYCFNDSGPLCKKDELGFAEWEKILSCIHAFGHKSILITGGEPFIHPDIIKILEHSIGLGLETSILSNGYKIAAFVEKYPALFSKLKVAQISLDSMDEEVHNSRRGYSGAFKDAVAAINALKTVNVPVEISMVVSDENISQVYDVAMYCKKNNSSLIVRQIVKGGRIRFLKPAERFYDKIKEELLPFCDINIGDKFYYVPDDNPYFSAERKQEIITLGADGNLKKALLKDSKVGDLLNLLNAA